MKIKSTKVYKIIFLLLLFLSCSACNYLGTFKEVYYYKYNDIPKISSYYIVFDDRLEGYSNYKYLQISQKIISNLNNIGMTQTNSINNSDYIVYYTYEVLQSSKEYKVTLAIKIFDRNHIVEVFNKDSSSISKKYKMIFDSNSILLSKEYNSNQSIACLIQAIFNKQILSKQPTINIKRKIQGEKSDIANSEGVYYCL